MMLIPSHLDQISALNWAALFGLGFNVEFLHRIFGNVLGPGVIGDRSVATLDAHGRYQEPTYRGNVYTLSTTAAGVTLAAGMVSPLGAAPTALIAIVNPASSGKNAVILGCTFGLVPSAATSAYPGSAVWNVIPAPSGVTAASANTPINNLTFKAAGSQMLGFVNAAMTGALAATMLRPIYASATYALAAATDTANAMLVREETAGEIIVQPGAAAAIAVGAAGTTAIAVASITWEEVPTTL